MANFKNYVKLSFQEKKLILSPSYGFDIFLDYVRYARQSDSIFTPLGLHFTTHTATMFEDITDQNGKVLLNKIYRLENLTRGINEIFRICGIEKNIISNTKMLNKNKFRSNFSLSKSQILKIENIFKEDFDIYENAD